MILPILGMAAIAVPVYYLCKPPQPDPYDWFPYMALGIIIVSVIYALILTRRDPALGDRVGSIVADEDHRVIRKGPTKNSPTSWKPALL